MGVVSRDSNVRRFRGVVMTRSICSRSVMTGGACVGHLGQRIVFRVGTFTVRTVIAHGAQAVGRCVMARSAAGQSKIGSVGCMAAVAGRINTGPSQGVAAKTVSLIIQRRQDMAAVYGAAWQ